MFSVHLMSCFREELARRLLPHDELLAIAGFKQICRVGLAIPELLDVQRSFDFRDILLDVLCEIIEVDGLSYWACHLAMATLDPKSEPTL